MENKKISIIGAGLVGSMNACFFAKRGYNVDLYEYRQDIRKTNHVRGRSINLALSVRGLSALDAIGLSETVLDHAIPMYGRMIHHLDGKLQAIPYGTRNQCIYSVGRRYLNEILLNEAEKNSNVSVRFEAKLVDSNLHKAELIFKRHDGSTETVQTDLIVGCDGAFSTVRKQMLKEPLFNFSQSFIEHGYLELCMPPRQNDGDFAMAKNYLHIWPRREFMLIALPNQDKTFTVTLFMPFKKFEALTTEDALVSFFRETFPDAVNLFTEKELVKEFFATKPPCLVSVKCNPYHVSDKAIIMGDAAHAMVPFYGQGMNAGFEDCLIFDQLMTDFKCNFGDVLEKFSTLRSKDAEAICDLALYNYTEMRHLVTTKTFRVRKHVDRFLHWCFPQTWIPLYTMVAFSRTRYHLCEAQRKWQNEILRRTTLLLTVAIFIAVIVVLFSQGGNEYVGLWSNRAVRSCRNKSDL